MKPETKNPSFGYEEAAIVRAMIEHENVLRNNRIVWFITIEGLLFAALGFAWKDARMLVYVLCGLGIATAISSSRELRLSSLGINHLKNWWKEWLLRNEPIAYNGPPVIGLDLSTAPTRVRAMWLRPAKALPILFIAAWVFLLFMHFFVPPKEDIQTIKILPAPTIPPIRR